MVVGDMDLYTAAQRLQEGVDAVDLGLELEIEADARAQLLALEIDACPVVPGAPRAGGLGAVAFDLARLAQLASSGRVSRGHILQAASSWGRSRSLLVRLSPPLPRGRRRVGQGVVTARGVVLAKGRVGFLLGHQHRVCVRRWHVCPMVARPPHIPPR